MYSLQYWNELEAQWKPAGFQTTDLAEAKASLKDHKIKTNGIIGFRVCVTEVGLPRGYQTCKPAP